MNDLLIKLLSDMNNANIINMYSKSYIRDSLGLNIDYKKVPCQIVLGKE